MRFASFTSEQKKNKKNSRLFHDVFGFIFFAFECRLNMTFIFSLSSKWLAISSLDYYVLHQMSYECIQQNFSIPFVMRF